MFDKVKKKKGYHINSENVNSNKEKDFLWDKESECLVAILAKRIEKVRNIKAEKVCKEINYMFLRKRSIGKKQNYGATQNQKDIINNKGY